MGAVDSSRETIVGLRAFDLDVSDRTVWIFVEVMTSEGRIGTGEASLHFGRERIFRHLRELDAALIGEAVRYPLEKLRAPPTADLPEVVAVSAIDAALLDIVAQRKGCPIARLLGGAARASIDAYANLNRRTSDRSADGFAASAAMAVAGGFKALKIAPFDRVRPDLSAPEARKYLGRAFDRVAAVREAIGPDVRLMVDCHWRLAHNMTADAIRAAAEHGVFWLETPLAEDAGNFDAIRACRAAANERGVRLAGGELKFGLANFLPLLEAELYDVVMPDMTFVGGYSDFMAVGEEAAKRSVAVSPHSPIGPVCHAHSVQVSAAVENFLIMEMQFAESPLFEECVEGNLPAPVDGTIAVPTAVGLGLRLAHATVESRARQGFA